MATTRLFLAAALILLGSCVVARAHDMPRGCYVVTNADVSRIPHGYLIIGVNRFVPDEDVIPSGDERWWVCTVGKGDYALFVPPRILEGEEP